MNDYDNEYTLIKDYHGDVKIINKTTKKVNLTKSVNNFKQSVNQQSSYKTISNSKQICLTKPRDLKNKKKPSYEDAFPPVDYEQYRVKPSQVHQQAQSNNIPPIQTNKTRNNLKRIIKLITLLILLGTSIKYYMIIFLIVGLLLLRANLVLVVTAIVFVILVLKFLRDYRNKRITIGAAIGKILKRTIYFFIIFSIFLGGVQFFSTVLFTIYPSIFY